MLPKSQILFCSHKFTPKRNNIHLQGETNCSGLYFVAIEGNKSKILSSISQKGADFIEKGRIWTIFALF